MKSWLSPFGYNKRWSYRHSERKNFACDVECNPLHGPRAEELIKALEAGEEVEKLNYVDEEIFASDDTVASVTAVNSLEEEGEYAVTPITQEIIDGRAY